MASQFRYSQDIRNAAVARIQAGETVTNVAQEIGIPRGTVDAWWQRHMATNPSHRTPAATPAIASNPSAVDLENAALRRRLADLEQKLQHATSVAETAPRAPVVSDAAPFMEIATSREFWLRAEAENDRRISRAELQSDFTAHFPDDRPIAIAFASDQHISAGNTVALRQMRLDAERIAETDGLYVILGGDGVDNHIKHRAAMMASRSQPDDQWKLYEYYLEIMAEKVLVIISGNHDHWTNQFAGVDMVRRLAESQKLHYAPHEAFIAAKIGQVQYTLAVRHQGRYNSSFNLCHTVKQWFRMGPRPFDVGAICHHHEPSVESFVGHNLKRWACRPGAYQVTSDYSRQYGFPLTWPTCPTFVFMPHERRIVGFEDMTDAATFLQAVRKTTP